MFILIQNGKILYWDIENFKIIENESSDNFKSLHYVYSYKHSIGSIAGVNENQKVYENNFKNSRCDLMNLDLGFKYLGTEDDFSLSSSSSDDEDWELRNRHLYFDTRDRPFGKNDKNRESRYHREGNKRKA